ncbi:MAG: UDP-2,3-diacylglucosamine diphosphatase [Luminiphilus sp.]|jgi:UDP-2,3-diacylglucosamine hydrolase|nr:UDP-2,3-diacylglucosamine diphosphatase [Luminiphilus sp.]
MATTLFISDLHLSDDTPEIEAGLYALLDREQGMERLFILGDFFEYWIGDDDDTPLHQRVIARLRAVSDSGSAVFIVRGNRDLALGNLFAEQIGGELLGDTTVIDVNGKPTLILHGDTLCTDDIEYQKMRSILHDPAWQAEMLQRPLAQRREFAQGLRAASKAKAENDPDNIIDANDQAIEAAFTEHSVGLMIHGHTHRPKRHSTNSGERLVLGDWSSSESWIIRADGSNCHLEHYSY